MNDTRRTPRKGIPAPVMITFVVGLIVAMVAIAWTQLPRAGLSTDLSAVGEGEPTLVLTRDVNYLGGAEVLELLKPIQQEYAGRAQFRIAHLGQPDGREFAKRYGTQDGDVSLLDGEGALLETVTEPGTESQVAELFARHGL